MDTLGLAMLLESLNKPCACERGETRLQCAGPVNRWWRDAAPVRNR